MSCASRSDVPDGNHVVVHLLQLVLGHLNGVGRGVQLVCLEALVGKVDLEGLIIRLSSKVSIGFLKANTSSLNCSGSFGRGSTWAEKAHRTSGTLLLRDADAALVVTERAAIAKGAGALARIGSALGATRVARRALENMARSGDASGRLGEDEVDRGDNRHSRSEILRCWGHGALLWLGLARFGHSAPARDPCSKLC